MYELCFEARYVPEQESVLMGYTFHNYESRQTSSQNDPRSSLITMKSVCLYVTCPENVSGVFAYSWACLYDFDPSFR